MNPETPRVVEYPLEYFYAQIMFANMWSKLTEDNLVNCMTALTALPRRITGEKKPPSDHHLWQKVSQLANQTHRLDKFITMVYELYLNQPHSNYSPPSYPYDNHHSEYFGYEYIPGNPTCDHKNTIKMHLLIRQRGNNNGFSSHDLGHRQQDLKALFTIIQSLYPNADTVIGGSWLYNWPPYKDSYPPDFTDKPQRLVPPGYETQIPNSVPFLSFYGDSIWGQFVNRHGERRQRVYTQFVEAVSSATSTLDLVNAFPYPPLRPRSPIEVFYEWNPIN